MVNVIQHERRRRQHSRLFKSALTSSITSSFSSTTSSASTMSTKLELMCAQLLNEEKCNDLPLTEGVNDSPLAMTLVDLLPTVPNKRYPSSDINKHHHRRATVDTMPPSTSKISRDNKRQRHPRRVTVDSPSPRPSSSVSLTNDEDRNNVAHNMEWTIKIPPFLQGQYSGTVNQKMEPHGKGTWIHYDDNHKVNAKISGRWYSGSFIPHEYPTDQEDCCKGSESDTSEKTVDSNSKPKRLSLKNHEEVIHCATLVKKALSAQKRRQYQVGEVLRSRSDIIDGATIDDSTQLQMISKLNEQDEAWIRRSDGKFTFAKVTKKHYELQEDGVMEETLVFEVNEKRSKKHLPKRLWGTYIWLPSYAVQTGQVNRSAPAA